MKCVICGKEMPENAKACPRCGTIVSAAGFPAQPTPQAEPQNQSAGQPAPEQHLQYPQAVPGSYPVGRPKKKTGLIVGVVALAAALVVVLGVLARNLLNNPLRRFDNALEQGDYLAAAELVDEIQDGISRNDAVQRLTDVAQTAYDDFNEGMISFDEAREIVENISYGLSTDGLVYLDQELSLLKGSKDAFEAGEAAEAAGEYLEAMTWYEQVIEEDANYPDAEERWNQAAAAYEAEVLAEAEAQADAGEYKQAVSLLEEGLDDLPDSEQIENRLEEYQELLENSGHSGSGSRITASGRYATIQDFLESDVMQNQLQKLQNTLEESGLNLQITAEGNKLVYTYVFDSLGELGDAGIDLMAGLLEDAMEEQRGTFEQLANSLKLAVDMDDPVVEVRYLAPDGTVIYSAEFNGD